MVFVGYLRNFSIVLLAIYATFHMLFYYNFIIIYFHSFVGYLRFSHAVDYNIFPKREIFGNCLKAAPSSYSLCGAKLGYP